MENASKALIIAGAILISIVLVSVGVIVVQSLNPDEAISQISQQEIDNFNSKFVTNLGNNRQGTIAKNIITNAITTNSQNRDDASRQIQVTLTGTGVTTINATADSAELSQMRNQIVTTARYNIECSYKESGLVDIITITKQ